MVELSTGRGAGRAPPWYGGGRSFATPPAGIVASSSLKINQRPVCYWDGRLPESPALDPRTSHPAERATCMGNSNDRSYDGDKTMALGRMQLNTASLLRVRCTHCEEPQVVEPRAVRDGSVSVKCGRCGRRFVARVRLDAAPLPPIPSHIPGRYTTGQTQTEDPRARRPGPPGTGEYRQPRRSRPIGSARKRVLGAISEKSAPHRDFTGEFAIPRLPGDDSSAPEDPPSTGSRARTPLGNTAPDRFTRAGAVGPRSITRRAPVSSSRAAPTRSRPLNRPPMTTPAPLPNVLTDGPATRPTRRDRPYATVAVEINLPPDSQTTE